MSKISKCILGCVFVCFGSLFGPLEMLAFVLLNLGVLYFAAKVVFDLS